jgi:hypothetical protein
MSYVSDILSQIGSSYEVTATSFTFTEDHLLELLTRFTEYPLDTTLAPIIAPHTLRLFECQFNPSAEARLAEIVALHSNCPLVVLRLADCGLSNIRALATALESSDTIEELWLSGNVFASWDENSCAPLGSTLVKHVMFCFTS